MITRIKPKESYTNTYETKKCTQGKTLINKLKEFKKHTHDSKDISKLWRTKHKIQQRYTSDPQIMVTSVTQKGRISKN